MNFIDIPTKTHVESINFVCLGQTDFAKELGKKGQSSDITIYDKKKDDKIMTFVIPSGYPDKIQPLITAVNLAEYSIINVNKLDRFLGEQIVALDLLQPTRNARLERLLQLPLTTTRVLPAIPARGAAARPDHAAAALGALDCVLMRVEQGRLAGRCGCGRLGVARRLAFQHRMRLR